MRSIFQMSALSCKWVFSLHNNSCDTKKNKNKTSRKTNKRPNKETNTHAILICDSMYCCCFFHSRKVVAFEGSAVALKIVCDDALHNLEASTKAKLNLCFDNGRI